MSPQREVALLCEFLPELRSNLECLLSDLSACVGITVQSGQTCEKLLRELQEEFEDFLFPRLSATLSPTARQQLAKLLKQDHNEETLRTFTLLHLPDFPLFLQQTFGEFRQQYFPRERVSC